MLKAIKHAITPGNKFDYERYGWNFLTMWLDPFTKNKLNDRSRIIQVDGNIKCGKQDFSKRLAQELGMKYMPPVDLDSYFINGLGYDYRALNPLLPERLRACDWEMFHENPVRHSAIHMQVFLFKLRLYQYIKACQHLLNTGQGVVIGRSVYTEVGIVDAMHDVGWLPMGHFRGDGVRFYDWRYRYHYIRNLTLNMLLRPHLTIYLETPVDVCMNNIKNCSDQMLRDSKAHVPEFLEAIDRNFKDSILPKQAYHGHVLSYEYPKRATDDEIRDVVDDINGLSFEIDHHDTRFEDWWVDGDKFWCQKNRRNYTTRNIFGFFEYLAIDWYDIAGLGDSITNADLILRNALYEANVGKFGYFSSKESDMKYTSPLAALIDYQPFNEVIERGIRSDFL